MADAYHTARLEPFGRELCGIDKCAVKAFHALDVDLCYDVSNIETVERESIEPSPNLPCVARSSPFNHHIHAVPLVPCVHSSAIRFLYNGRLIVEYPRLRSLSFKRHREAARSWACIVLEHKSVVVGGDKSGFRTKVG
jgi:hypothetical protein